MNWYRKILAQQSQERWQYDDNTLYEYYDDHNLAITNQIMEFNNSKPGDRQPWRLIPLARLKKIWADYARTGFVRDEKGIALIEEIIIENVQKIQANTMLMGHTPQNVEGILEDNEMTMNETDEHDYGDWAMDENGAWRISDYALSNLVNGTMELMYAKTAEEKLQKIDFILNVCHRRSDIASWFVEGGSRGLNELKVQVV